MVSAVSVSAVPVSAESTGLATGAPNRRGQFGVTLMKRDSDHHQKHADDCNDAPKAGAAFCKLGVVGNWLLIVVYSFHLVVSRAQLQSGFNSLSLFQLLAPSGFWWPRNWRKAARQQQITEFGWRTSLYVGVWGAFLILLQHFLRDEISPTVAG